VSILLLAGLCLSAGLVVAQPAGSFSVMNWNLLNWPNTSDLINDTTTRLPYYRTVVEYVNPDILVTEENQTSYSTTWFLNSVMNKRRAGVYRQGNFIQGPDSNNGIFYKDSLFRFVSNVPVETTLRDINQFTLVFKPSGDTIRIYAVHLKASTGSANESQRAQEVDSLRKRTDLLAAGTDFLVSGDFNIYGAYEAAYQKLLADRPSDDGNFIDVLGLTGIWNDPVYAPYHTQSTRLPSVGGGSNGGMDDRFDMFLMSNALVQSGGLYYIPGTYEAIGNDGNHYNQSINYGTNTAVPASVADALYGASDHLPVMVRIQAGTSPGVEELAGPLADLRIYPNPNSGYLRLLANLSRPVNQAHLRLTDLQGRAVFSEELNQMPAGAFHFERSLPEVDRSGVFLISLDFDNYLTNRILTVIR
jgi:hypothetical protein